MHPNDCEGRAQRDESGDYDRALRDFDGGNEAVVRFVGFAHLVEAIDTRDSESRAIAFQGMPFT